ncbi:MAG: MFS transporter [Veillonellales bacterium]
MNKLNHKTLIGRLGAAGFISAADNWVISPVLPAIASGFDVSVSQAGVILTAYLLPYGIMQPVYGFLSDCWGKAKLLQGIVAGLAVGTAGCFMANSLWALCCWRFVTGFFAAGIIAVSLALIGDTVSVSERQKNVGMFMGIVFLGQGLSAGLGGIFAQYVSWRTAFAFFAAAAAGTVLLLQKLPPGLSDSTGHSFFAEIKRVTLSSTGKVIFPLAFFAGFLLLGSYSYLGAFFHEIAGLTYLQVGIVIMLFGFACFLAGGQVGRLGQKIGQKKTVAAGGCLALLTAVLLTMFPCRAVGCLATISLGVSYIFIQSTLATIAFDVSSNSKGLPSALIGLGLFGGGGFGTMFNSWLLSQSSYLVLWLTFGAGILIFMLAAIRFLVDEAEQRC